MNILQVINSLCTGGAEVFVVNLAIAQQRAGHNVTLFTYAGILDEKGKQLHNLLVQNSIRYISANIVSNRNKYKIPLILRRIIKDVSPDIAHSHLEQSDLFLALSVLGLAERPDIFRTIHNVTFKASIPHWIHRWMSGRFKLNIACGRAVMAAYPYLGERAHCVENGVNLDLLFPIISRDQIRKQLGLGDSDICLVNIGSFNYRNGVLQKAQDIILEALTSLHGKQFKMVFLGDGQQRNAIEHRSKILGLEKYCIFLGSVDNPADYINASDLVVMPSRFEGMSIACIEAVCLGKPVVLSDIPAFEAFQENSTIFVEKESSGDLAKAIERYFANADSFNFLAEQNAEKYRRLFSINRVAQMYIEAYLAIPSKAGSRVIAHK